MPELRSHEKYQSSVPESLCQSVTCNSSHSGYSRYYERLHSSQRCLPPRHSFAHPIGGLHHHMLGGTGYRRPSSVSVEEEKVVGLSGSVMAPW